VVAESAVAGYARKRDRAMPHLPRCLSSSDSTSVNVTQFPHPLYVHSAHCFIMAEEKSTEYVTLVSNDGYEFKILRSAACIAGTIKKALDPMCTQTVMHQMKMHVQS
jgi:hypothetical protein